MPCVEQEKQKLEITPPITYKTTTYQKMSHSNGMHSPGLKKLSSYALFLILLTPVISNASNLKIFTSADAESNAHQSFIIVPDDAIIPDRKSVV